MSGVDQNELTRPLNQKQMLALYESMQKTLDSTRRAIEALQLSSNEKQLSNITQNGAMICQDFKVNDLKVLERKNVEKFIYQYERLSLQQKRDINLTQFVDLDLFIHLRRLDVTRTNEDLVDYLKILLLEMKEQALEEAEVMIAKHVKYNFKLREEDAIKILFSEVQEIIKLQPCTAKLNKKKIALAIFAKLPKYIWVEASRLSLNPALTDVDHVRLQQYVLECLPPLCVRNEMKKRVNFKKIQLGKFKESAPIEVNEVNTKGERKPHSHFKKQSSNDEPDLCNHCWFYGHRSFKCWMRLKLIRNGNKNPSSQPKPDGEVLRKRLLKWKENKKKGWKRNFKKPVEKSTFTSNEVTPANEGAVEDVETDIIEVVPAGSVDEIFLSECTDVANAEVRDVAENEINHVEAELVLETRKGPMVVDGILDSGARKTSGARNLFEKFCWKIEDIKRKTFVRVASGNLYPVFKIGHLLPSVRIPGFGDYSLGPVAVLLVEQVKNWTKLLIGKEVLKLHGLDPTQILVRRLRNTGNGRSSKLTEKVEKSVKSFKETCEVNECITVEGAYLANWFKSKVFGDLEFDVVNTMAINPHVFSEPGIENPLELQKGMVEAFAVEENKISFEEGGAWPEPVIFNARHDAELEELTGVGENLEVTREADLMRLKDLLKGKLKEIPAQIFGEDKKLKMEFDDLILHHVAAFGDDLSPTQLSLLKPMRCSLMEGTSVGVFNAIALGIEKEEFMKKRVDQMIKNKIVEVNDDPTTCMRAFVVPKKGPKKYRMVVDFRPLNAVTQKVVNNLPNIDLQVAKIKGNTIFGSFDLLSGFDYLPTHHNSQHLFTFGTPWGVSYPFRGAPQGWCNTPSLFSQRVITHVLTPASLWPNHALQWIDDTVLFALDVRAYMTLLRSFLKAIIDKRLRLNIGKCDLIAQSAVFCGHKLTKDGYRLDDTYLKKLMERPKPTYVHELAQLIYLGNWVSKMLPGFSELRKRMTGEFNIYGRLKKLERTKVLLEWSEEMNHAYEKLTKEVKLAFSNTLGYYDQKLDLVLFVDASEFYWSYFICQTSDAIKLEFPMDANYDVIAMASGTFRDSSLNWHISSKELFPVVIASQKHSYFLKSNEKKKILFTDHKNLYYILNPIKASRKSYSERLTHWSLIFQDICLEVHHIPGEQNVAADILSRWLNPEFDKVEADEVLVAVATVEHFNVQHFWEKVDEIHAGLQEGYVLTLIDALSRVTLLKQCKNANATNVMNILWEWHSHYDLADDFILLSDKGSHYVNAVVDAFVRQSGESQKFTVAYAPYTNGAAEIQNKQILKNLRTLLSEYNLKVEDWPEVLVQVQCYLNSKPLRSRNNLTPSRFCWVRNLEAIHELKEVSLELEGRIREYQETAFSFAERSRQYANALYNKKYKLTPMHFHVGEFVLVSKPKRGSKVKPQWTGPFQIIQQLGSYLYLLKNLCGDEEEVHASRMMFYAPSHFLPSAKTKICYLNDSEKLEIKKLIKIKKKDDEYFLLVHWRGFPLEESTWEPVQQLFEDLPSLVVDFLLKNKFSGIKACLTRLRLANPEAEIWSADEYNVDLCDLHLTDKELDDFLSFEPVSQFMIPMFNSLLRWKKIEVYILKQCILKFGFSKYGKYAEFLKNRPKRQIYSQLQRLVGKQAISVYTNLRLDVDASRKDNNKSRGAKYFIEKEFNGETHLFKLRIFTAMRYAKMHRLNTERAEKVDIMKYFNCSSADGIAQFIKFMEEKGEVASFPLVNWFNVDKEVQCWKKKFREISRFEAAMAKKKIEVLRAVDARRDDLQCDKLMPDSKHGFDVKRTKLTNLYEFRKENFMMQHWIIHPKVKFFHGDVNDFIKKFDGGAFEVVHLDPPYRFMAKNPIRGAANFYDTISDHDLRKLDFTRLMKNTIVFLWTFPSKKSLAMDIFKKNNIKYMDHLLWIKLSAKWKLRSTFGKLTQKCSEELLIGVYGKLPDVLKNRNFGKECVFAEVVGNSCKPEKFYEIIEVRFEKQAKKLDLFSRKNNLRLGWLAVGNEL
eukprot:maker-scaffold_16-augustus-gene-5.18-mRNA-1 protein AED:0.67 eAED:0.67 QI:0/0/0/1/0.5/0.33/3/0/2013